MHDALRELGNVFSGRISVYLSDMSGVWVDISIPKSNKISLNKNVFTEEESLIFRAKFMLDGKNVCLILALNKDKFKNKLHIDERYFDEMKEDFSYIFEEVSVYFGEIDNAKNVYDIKRERINAILNDEMVKYLEFNDEVNYVYNDIFIKETKESIGGLYIFYL
jgi:hypothetical protein